MIPLEVESPLGSVPLRLIVGLLASWHTVSPSWPEALKHFRHPARARGAGAPLLGVGQHTDRGPRRSGGDSGCVRGARRLTDGGPLFGVAIFTCICLTGSAPFQALVRDRGRAQFGPPGYELNLLYLACLAALVLVARDPLAIDGLVRRRGTGRAIVGVEPPLVVARF